MRDLSALLETGLAGQRALVVGAGESGLAVAEYLARQGVSVRLVDSRGAEDLRGDGHLRLPAQVSLQLALPEPFSADLLQGVDLLVPSPGLSPHGQKPHSIAALLAAAEAAGVMVVTELDLFDWALDASLERPPVLAVTGTNGKTTTAMLTAHLLRSAGLDAQQAGNVSPSLLRAFMDCQDAGRSPDVWVLELSSFQLALCQRFSPTASVILNLTEDHLDWHADMADYLAAKLRILGLPRPMGTVWLNREEPLLAAAVRERLAGQPAPSRGLPAVQVRSFGLGPCPEGELGLGILQEGLDWIGHWPAASEARSTEPLAPRRLMPANALRIGGRHNLLNAMAALGLAMAVQADLAPMLHGLRAYLGEPHRLQVIAQLGGISFVDDSKGTNVGATVAALRGEDLPVAVILGGDGKGQAFGPLIEALADRGAIAICLGRDGPTIADLAEARGIQTLRVDTLPEAVQQATSALKARIGEGRGQVLLSPACASLDMFRNYAHRAEVFASAVAEICEASGIAS